MGRQSRNDATQATDSVLSAFWPRRTLVKYTCTVGVPCFLTLALLFPIAQVVQWPVLIVPVAFGVLVCFASAGVAVYLFRLRGWLLRMEKGRSCWDLALGAWCMLILSLCLGVGIFPRLTVSWMEMRQRGSEPRFRLHCSRVFSREVEPFLKHALAPGNARNIVVAERVFSGGVPSPKAEFWMRFALPSRSAFAEYTKALETSTDVRRVSFDSAMGGYGEAPLDAGFFWDIQSITTPTQYAETSGSRRHIVLDHGRLRVYALVHD